HPVLSADGAYVRLADGYVSLLFYLDRKYPIHGKNDSLTFGNTRRELLHEVRLPYEAAKATSNQLVHGLYLYDKYDPTSIRNRGSMTMDKAADSLAKLFEEDPDARSTFERFSPIFTQLFTRTLITSDEGMKEVVEIVANCIEQHKAELDAITVRHPRKVDQNKPSIE